MAAELLEWAAWTTNESSLSLIDNVHGLDKIQRPHHDFHGGVFFFEADSIRNHTCLTSSKLLQAMLYPGFILTSTHPNNRNIPYEIRNL